MSPSEKNFDVVPTTVTVEDARKDDSVMDLNDGDEALKALELSDEPLVIDEATNKALLRKIDWHLMPIMCGIYGLNFLDKISIGYASIMGLKEDINLVGSNYQWLGSMFYIGYLAWEFPANRLLQKLPLAKWTSFNIVIWGIVLATFATVNNFAGAVAVRFFLGVFEASITPGFALFTSQWYKQREQSARVGLWFSFNGWAQIPGGCIAYAIAVSTAKNPAAIESWRILFIVFGLFTSCVGVLFFWLMPDSQLNAKWLTPHERALAVERIRCNSQGIGNKKFKRYQLKEALTDPMTWSLAFGALTVNIPNGGITNYFGQLIVAFGFTPQESLLLSIPGGVLASCGLLFTGLAGSRWGYRCFCALSGVIAAVIGMCLVIFLAEEHKVGRLIGFYMTQLSSTAFSNLFGFISSNVAGYTKKTVVAAIYLVCYCVGNMIGPQIFRPKDAPKYVPAEISIICIWGACAANILFINYYYRKQNRMKEAITSAPGYVHKPNQEFLDLTDRENPEFRYSP